MEQLAIILGGEMGRLPTIYLGIPRGTKSKSKGIWDSLLEKCEKTLTMWKSQYLSLGRRLTLVNAILDALPTYMLSLLPFPSSVIQRLDKIKRSSLWQENKEKIVLHLVKWKDIIRSKKQGGLGIWKSKHQCKAFKIKWLWRYAQEP